MYLPRFERMDIELVVKHVLKAIVENFMKLKFDFAEKNKAFVRTRKLRHIGAFL